MIVKLTTSTQTHPTHFMSENIIKHFRDTFRMRCHLYNYIKTCLVITSKMLNIVIIIFFILKKPKRKLITVLGNSLLPGKIAEIEDKLRLL